MYLNSLNKKFAAWFTANAIALAHGEAIKFSKKLVKFVVGNKEYNLPMGKFLEKENHKETIELFNALEEAIDSGDDIAEVSIIEEIKKLLYTSTLESMLRKNGKT